MKKHWSLYVRRTNSLQGDPNVYLTDHKVKQASYGYKEMGMFDIMSYIPSCTMIMKHCIVNTIQPCGIIICLIIICLLLII